MEWVHLDEVGFNEPFFQLTLNRNVQRPFNQLFRQRSSLAELRAWAEASPGIPPTGFVFHVSRCGSTLLWRLLSELPGALALSEPGPLDAMIRLPGFAPAEHLALLRAMVSALGQRRTPEHRRLFIKLDSWSILYQPLIRAAFPDTPWLFLYRDPLEVMASHMTLRGMHTVPTLLSPALFGLDAETVAAEPEAYSARVIGAIYVAGLEAYRPGQSLLVEYVELPDAAWTTVARHFGVEIDPATRAAMAAASEQDAKHGESFQPDGQAKRQGASDTLRAAADRWIRPTYDALEALRRSETAS